MGNGIKIKMTYKSLISSKFVLILLILFLGFLSYIKWQQYQSFVALENEKQKLTLQAQHLQEKNQQLSQSINYLNTPEFKERQAREQLGLKKDGEVVYNFTEKPAAPQIVPPPAPTPKPNYEKWINYFIN